WLPWSRSALSLKADRPAFSDDRAFEGLITDKDPEEYFLRDMQDQVPRKGRAWFTPGSSAHAGVTAQKREDLLAALLRER
ncbi:MAG TPA: hypothetical protein VEO56_06645, partial [Bacteroidota bacterium]|nr:hypothetical protein [Bacteroidota bacterium]